MATFEPHEGSDPPVARDAPHVRRASRELQILRMALHLIEEGGDHVERALPSLPGPRRVFGHVARVHEDGEELRIDAAGPKTPEIRVRMQLLPRDTTQEPAQNRDPVEHGSPLVWIRPVHSQVEAEVEDERRDVVVAVDHDVFAVDPRGPFAKVLVVLPQRGRRPGESDDERAPDPQRGAHPRGSSGYKVYRS